MIYGDLVMKVNISSRRMRCEAVSSTLVDSENQSLFVE